MKIPLRTITVRNKNNDAGYFGTDQVNVYYDTDKALVESFTVPKESIDLVNSVGRGRYNENSSPGDEVIYAVATGTPYTSIVGGAVFPERNRYYILDTNGGSPEALRAFDLRTGEYLSSDDITGLNATVKVAIDRQNNYFIVGSSSTVRVYDFNGTAITASNFSAGAAVYDVFSGGNKYYSLNNSSEIYESTKGSGSSSLIVDVSTFTPTPTLSVNSRLYVDETNEKIYFTTNAGDYVYVCSDLNGTEGTHIQVTGTATPIIGMIWVDEVNNILYAVDRSANTEVHVYDLDTSTKIGGTGSITGITGQVDSHAFDLQYNLIYIQ